MAAGRERAPRRNGLHDKTHPGVIFRRYGSGAAAGKTPCGPGAIATDRGCYPRRAPYLMLLTIPAWPYVSARKSLQVLAGFQIVFGPS